MRTLEPQGFGSNTRGRWVRYDGRAVFLPNATRIGFAQWHATPGMLIRINADTDSWARVVGRIVEHDSLEGQESTTAHKGSLLVNLLGSTLAFSYEAWIDPSDVIACYEPERAAEFLAQWFAADVHALAKEARKP